MSRPKHPSASSDRSSLPFENVLHTDIPFQSISMDVEAFDNLMRSQGVTLVHYRAMPCPVGLVDLGDNRRPHEDHESCSNGMLYIRAGLVSVSFIGNGKDSKIGEAAVVDGSMVTVTLPRFYDGTEDPVMVLPFDRCYIADDSDVLFVPFWQKFIAHETGHDRLQFPVESVEMIVDANGARYGNGDFTILKGQIVWSDKRPPSGTVCSVRFRYRPYWYILKLLHEVRIAQAEDLLGERRAVRMPQSAVLSREFIFENEKADDLPPDSPRKAPASEDGGFGVR